MKIIVSTYDGDYAGYIVKADMSIRGMSIDLEKYVKLILLQTTDLMVTINSIVEMVKDMEH